MTLPKDAKRLGVREGDLAITGAGIHTTLTIDLGAQRDLAANRTATAAEASRSRFYLVLENIRGTQDATALNVYVNLPEGANPGDHRELLAGSVSLFGLRRASLRHDPDGGSGLTFILDVTQIVTGGPAAAAMAAGNIAVSIVPHRRLSEPTDIVVGRLALYRQQY